VIHRVTLFIFRSLSISNSSHPATPRHPADAAIG
jgi:hypothetical protein